MNRDLNGLLDTLWTQFERAVERQGKYYDSEYPSSSIPGSYAVENRRAIAELAQTILETRRDIRAEAAEQAEAARAKEGGLDKSPVVRSLSAPPARPEN
jgi:hypothetical protein